MRAVRGYELLEEIGRGAFATVWRARQKSVARDVAIKIIRAELATQPEFVRRFEAEAQIVARLQHPHVVPLVDFWREPDAAYLVMLHVPGGTLEQRLDDGPLDPDSTRSMLVQTGSALSAAHAQGVVHRDVKSANILFDQHDFAFLSDFGIAFDGGAGDDSAAALSPGTPLYAAPEQLRREPVTARTDVFSLGIVAYECLAGALPFAELPAGPELFHHQLNEPLPDLGEVHGVDRRLAAAVTKATAKAPKDRFASVDEFLAAIAGPAAPPRIIAPGRNPYLGLRPFGEADADLFFGRERLVAELVAQLSTPDASGRSLVLVGGSGSGKSSVIRAGLLPALRAGAVPGSQDWFIATMTPGDDPVAATVEALNQIAIHPIDDLAQTIRSGPRGLLRAIRRAVGPDQSVALVIDQFEELYTSPEEPNDFIDALATAVSEPGGQLRLIATLRADFYDRPLSHPTFSHVLKQAAVDVTPLAADELERAVTGPAHAAGLVLDTGLLGRIVGDTHGEAAPLPLLQYLMSELTDRAEERRLTEAAFDELGGIHGALVSVAERLYGQADDSERAAIRSVFSRLVVIDAEGHDLRRRARLSDLAVDSATERVLNRLAEARLLAFGRDPVTRAPIVEVAHEALLRRWPRLVRWFEEDREALRTAAAVAAAADRWERDGRPDADLLRGARLAVAADVRETHPDLLRSLDENLLDASLASEEARRTADARQMRRLRRRFAASVVGLVIAVAAALFANDQRNRADDEASAAQAARAAAEDARAVADAEARRAESAREASDQVALVSRAEAIASENPTVALLLAAEAYRRDPSIAAQGALLATLGAWDGVVQRLELPDVGTTSCPGRAWQADGYDWPTDDGFAVYAQGDEIITVDPVSGASTRLARRSDPCGRIIVSHSTGPVLMQSDGGISLIATDEAADGGEIPLIETTAPVSFATSAGPQPTIGVVTDPGPIQGELHLFNEQGEPIASPVATDLSYGDLWWAPSGEVVLGTGAPLTSFLPSRVQLVRATDGTVIWGAETGSRPTIAAFSPSEQWIAVVTFAGEVVVLAADDGSQLGEWRPDAGAVESVTFVDDDRLAIATGAGVELWNLAANVLERRFSVPNAHHVRRLATGQLVVHSRDDDVATVVDAVAAASHIADARYPVRPTERPTLLGGSSLVGLADVQGATAAIVDLPSSDRNDITSLLPADSVTVGVIPGSSASDFWTVAADGTIRRHEGRAVTAAVETSSIDGALLVGAGGSDGRVALALRTGDDGVDAYLVDLAAMQVVNGPVDADGACGCGIFVGPDLESLVVDIGGTVTVHPPAGAPRVTVSVTGTPSTLAVDSSTGALYRGTRGGRVQQIDLIGRTVATIDDFEFAIDGIEPVGEDSLVVATEEGTAWLLDLSSGERIGRLWEGTAGIDVHPEFDPNTRRVRIANRSEVVDIPIDPREWFDRACEIAGRNLSRGEWERHVPGEAEYRATCALWPAGE